MPAYRSVVDALAIRVSMLVGIVIGMIIARVIPGWWTAVVVIGMGITIAMDSYRDHRKAAGNGEKPL